MGYNKNSPRETCLNAHVDCWALINVVHESFPDDLVQLYTTRGRSYTTGNIIKAIDISCVCGTDRK
ncbi:hypothetical protein GHT06_021018 [Daphnia sinensis]|uniref:Uncharacterized protein n=1 Tax=Daphnia sinensis TaxID=1820382 RepID=A0AAD5PMI9_9CRUS|nr:hypothetical protein GHT06_021018 [Daphnia sinensis]